MSPLRLATCMRLVPWNVDGGLCIPRPVRGIGEREAMMEGRDFVEVEGVDNKRRQPRKERANAFVEDLSAKVW